MQLECAFIGAAAIGNHEYQLRAKMGAKELGQIRCVPAIDLKMKFVAAPDVGVHCPALESFSQRGS